MLSLKILRDISENLKGSYGFSTPCRIISDNIFFVRDGNIIEMTEMAISSVTKSFLSEMALLSLTVLRHSMGLRHPVTSSLTTCYLSEMAISSLTISFAKNIVRVDIKGFRRPIGCLKLQVTFRKRATKYRALVRKMTYKDRASYGSSPHCTHIHTHVCGIERCSQR